MSGATKTKPSVAVSGVEVVGAQETLADIEGFGVIELGGAVIPEFFEDEAQAAQHDGGVGVVAAHRVLVDLERGNRLELEWLEADSERSWSRARSATAQPSARAMRANRGN